MRIFKFNPYGFFVTYFIINLFAVVALASPNYVAVSVRNPVLSFDVTDDGADTSSASGASLHYQPKVPTIVGVETSLKGFTLGYSTTLSRSEQKEEQKFTDYNLNYYFESIGFDAIYSEFLGFRLTSADKFDLTTIPQDEKFRKDFAIKTTNLNLYYFPLRWGWKLNHSLDPSENEHTSGVGFGVVGSYNNIGLSTQYGAIPESFQSTFGKEGSIKKGSFDCTSLSAAVAATLAFKPLFLSVMTSFGNGKQTQKYETSTESKSNEGMGSRKSLIGILGFSTQTFFMALQVSNESPRLELKDLAIEGSHTEAAFKLGFKF